MVKFYSAFFICFIDICASWSEKATEFLMFDCSSVHMSLKPMHHIIFISVKVQFSLNSKIKEGKERKKTDGTHAECEAQARLRPKVWS